MLASQVDVLFETIAMFKTRITIEDFAGVAACLIAFELLV
jgi:hypothetical protein